MSSEWEESHTYSPLTTNCHSPRFGGFMMRSQSGADRALEALADAMVHWRNSAEQLHRLGRLQLESLLMGNIKEFGQILWEKQLAHRQFRKAATHVDSLKKRARKGKWDSEQSSEMRETAARIKQAERDVAGLLREAALFELRSEEVLRMKMSRRQAA